MQNSPLRRAGKLTVSLPMLCLVAVASCSTQPKVPVIPGHVAPREAERDAERLAEAGRPGVLPSRDSLGGPYGNGVPYPGAKHAITPAAPKKIDGMTDSELVSYLNSLTYEMGRGKTELALLNCSRGGVACTPTEWVPVFIQPEIGMDLRGPTDIPAEGMVVARIINFDIDGRSEARFGFPPSQRAWWYVDWGPMERPRSRFFIRTHSATGAAVQFIGPTLPFSPCRNDPLWIAPAMAKWRKCGSRQSHNPLHNLDLASAARPRFLPISFAPGARDLPPAAAVASDVWVKCMANCCIGG